MYIMYSLNLITGDNRSHKTLQCTQPESAHTDPRPLPWTVPTRRERGEVIDWPCTAGVDLGASLRRLHVYATSRRGGGGSVGVWLVLECA